MIAIELARALDAAISGALRWDVEMLMLAEFWITDDDAAWLVRTCASRSLAYVMSLALKVNFLVFSRTYSCNDRMDFL